MRDDSTCTDCGVKTDHTGLNEWYMVERSVWKEATKRVPANILCIGCLEQRLKRRVEAKDFAPVLLNFMGSGSERLKDRLKGFKELKMEQRRLSH